MAKKRRPTDIEVRSRIMDQIAKLKSDDSIPLTSVLIDDVQPHSINLAKTTLDYLAQNTSPNESYFKSDPVVRITKLRDGTMINEDGDHRLYQIQQNGSDVYTQARVFDMSNPEHQKTLLEYRWIKDTVGFLVGSWPDRYMEKELDLETIKSKPFKAMPEDNSYSQQLDVHIEKIIDQTNFIRHEGIYRPSDLEGRTVKDRYSLDEDFRKKQLDYREEIAGL